MAKTTTHRAGTSGRSYRLSRRLADPPSSLHGRGSSNGPSRRWQRIIARTVHSLRGSRASWKGRPKRPPITRFHARDEASGHILQPGPWNAQIVKASVGPPRDLIFEAECRSSRRLARGFKTDAQP